MILENMNVNYNTILKKIHELRADIESNMSCLIPRDVEVEYVKALVELLKIESLLIIVNELRVEKK